MKLRLLSLMVATALAASAQAADTPKAATTATPRATTADDAAKRAELERARSEMARYGRRVAELSRELGGPDAYRYSFTTSDLERSGSRPAIGIVMSANPAANGIRLAAVTPNGPAAKAGLRAGDVLISINGKSITAKGEAAINQASELLGGLKEGQQVRIGYTREGKAGQATVKAENLSRVMVFTRGDGAEVTTLSAEHAHAVPLIAPHVEMELARMAAPCPPGAKDCNFPALTQAYRWNGLNLASMNAKLGRYFGTDQGVLVLGEGLEALEPGDVIQRIDGQPVKSPRDAMRALRDQDEGGKVKVELLRERKPRTVEVTVPEAPPVNWYAPPAPPAPPTPPAPPVPRTAPVAPTPPTPPSMSAPPPPPAPPAPPALDDDTVVFADGVTTRIVSRQQWVDDEGQQHIVVQTEATTSD